MKSAIATEIRTMSLLLILLGLAACATSTRDLVRERMESETLEDSLETYMDRAEAAYEQRTDMAQLQEAIDNWERALRLDPDNKELMTQMSLAYYQLGQEFRREFKEEKLKEIFFRGKELGYGRLLLEPEIAEMVKPEPTVENLQNNAVDLAHLINKETMPAAFWGTANMARWAELEGILKVAFLLDDAEAVVFRCHEIWPEYWYGATGRFLGAYYVEIPYVYGRDPEKSKEHFEGSLAIEPNYLETLYMYGYYYGRAVDDEEFFIEKMNQILDAQTDPDAEYRLENERAKVDAQWALDHLWDIF